MARADVWFTGKNDMVVRLDTVRSSTMATGSYLDSSTNIQCDVWSATSTASTANKLVSGRNMAYVSDSNGRYDGTIHSSEHSMTYGTIGMAVITVDHLGLDGEWRPRFRVLMRFTT